MLRIVLHSLVIVTTAFAAYCHHGWYLYTDKCYGYGESMVTWADAQEMCRDAGGSLAEIESGDENNFLKELARNKSAQRVWLGGTDIFDEGVWTWVSTGRRIYPYIDWAPGQPDEVGSGEDCLAMKPSGNYQWSDWQCQLKGNFICEAETY